VRLHDQEVEHRDRVERRTTAFGAVAIADPCDQPAPERLEINGPLKGFERVAAGADAGELLLKAEKAPLIRGKASTRATKPVNRNALGMGKFLRVSSWHSLRDVPRSVERTELTLGLAAFMFPFAVCCMTISQRDHAI
jgi:hypothetical protein